MERDLEVHVNPDGSVGVCIFERGKRSSRVVFWRDIPAEVAFAWAKKLWLISEDAKRGVSDSTTT